MVKIFMFLLLLLLFFCFWVILFFVFCLMKDFPINNDDAKILGEVLKINNSLIEMYLYRKFSAMYNFFLHFFKIIVGKVVNWQLMVLIMLRKRWKLIKLWKRLIWLVSFFFKWKKIMKKMSFFFFFFWK